MKKLFILAFISSIIFACGAENTESDSTQETPTEQTTTQTPAPAPQTGPSYPTYPAEKVQLLIDSCDYIDIVFYTVDFALNQKNKSDIHGMLNYITRTGPEFTNSSCQPIGRIFFQVDGRNAAEADIYFQNECLYWLFMENNKPAYANNFTQQGVNFFNRLFSQIQTQPNGG